MAWLTKEMKHKFEYQSMQAYYYNWFDKQNCLNDYFSFLFFIVFIVRKERIERVAEETNKTAENQFLTN